MDASQTEPSPDRVKMTVNGIDFEVAYDLSQPGTYHYTRLTGPATGYGFTGRRSDGQRGTIAEHEAQIRAFLDAVDPITGYIEDEPDDDGEDDAPCG